MVTRSPCTNRSQQRGKDDGSSQPSAAYTLSQTATARTSSASSNSSSQTQTTTQAVFADPDRYAAPFFPVAEELYQKGDAAEKNGDLDAARDFFLRCGAVYRIARFPINRSPATQKAWELGLDA